MSEEVYQYPHRVACPKCHRPWPATPNTHCTFKGCGWWKCEGCGVVMSPVTGNTTDPGNLK